MEYTPTSHPAADAFPMLSGADYEALRDDIARNGQHQPIYLTPDGLILDGRNRWRACAELGLSPITRTYDGADPVGFVISLNLTRRHLNESQRALIAARLANMPSGTRTDLLPIGSGLISRGEAADKLNVGERSVHSAAALRREADPETVAAVERGEMSVSGALSQVRNPVPFVPTAADYADPYGDDDPGLWQPPAEAPRASHQLINASTNNEWYTPDLYVDAAREVMGGIDLDPASCAFANRTVQATHFYTAEDDGLAQPWSGRVWMNPPYGTDDGESNQARWTRRLIDEYRAGRVQQACILVNAVPGNAWFAPLWDFPICFVSRRIRFYNEQTEAGQPTHSNAIIYLGPHIARFAEVFGEFGPVAFRGLDGPAWRVVVSEVMQCAA